MKKIEMKLAIILAFVVVTGSGWLFFYKKNQPVPPVEKKEAAAKKSDQLIISPEKGFGDLKKIMSEENSSARSGGGSAGTLNARNEVATDKMMIYPPIPPMEDYKLVYAGGDFALPQGTVQVLKKKKGKGEGGDVLWDNLFGNFAKMAKLELASFGNLTASSLNFYEDKDFGLNFSLDLGNSSAYISPQWDKWPNPSLQCGDDQRCYEASRLTKKDWLTDEEFLKIADEFLGQIGINEGAYEPGRLEGNNQFMPMSSGEINVKSQVSSSEESALRVKDEFVPDAAAVFYQQKIEDQKVFDLSGNQEGLRVEVDVRQKKVRGASPITSSDFFSSAYPAETEQRRIIEIAENGGWKRSGDISIGTVTPGENPGNYQEPKYPFEEKPKKKEIKLDKPTLGLVKIWDYSRGNGQNEELFIPAFIFPVLDQAENFWPKNVIVPAVREE